MDINTITTTSSRLILNRILKSDLYLYSQTYYEAGDFGLAAIDQDTLEEKAHLKFNNDRITDFTIYSDSRIAIRSDNQLSVLSFDGISFSKICSVRIKSPIITGIACNENFAFASCGSSIIVLDINTGKIAKEFPIIDFSYVRNLYATSNYLFARKCSIDYKTYKLCAYRINSDYSTNPEGPLYQIDEIESPRFDMDMGRLSVDDSLNIIETGEETHRLVTFDGNNLTVVGNLTPHYPALEFVKHGILYFTSPDSNLTILSLSGTTFSEQYRSSNSTKYSAYVCPGTSLNRFYITRGAISDDLGKNISIKEIAF